MEFNQAIVNIIETFIDAWNSEDYSVISATLIENIIVATEPINIDGMQAPAVEIKGIENAINYWKEMKAQFNVEIDKYDILVAGRNSQVLCQYKNMPLTMLAHVHINEYGKATKIINTLKQPS